MALEQVYSNENGIIFCDQDKNLIEIRMQKHCSGHSLRQVFLEALRIATASQLRAWLFDMRKVSYMEMADQNWMIDEYYPLFDKQHQHRLSVLVSEPYLELLSSIRVRNRLQLEPEISNIIDVRIFLGEDDAQSWLVGGEGKSHLAL